jgi:monoamine oxidase
VTPFSDKAPPLPQEDLIELRAAIETITEMGDQIPLDAPWTAPQAAAWDSQTLQEWLAANIYTDGARNSLTTVMAGSLSAPASQSSLLHALFMMASGSGIKNWAAGPHGGILGFRTVGLRGGGRHVMAEM